MFIIERCIHEMRAAAGRRRVECFNREVDRLVRRGQPVLVTAHVSTRDRGNFDEYSHYDRAEISVQLAASFRTKNGAEGKRQTHRRIVAVADKRERGEIAGQYMPRTLEHLERLFLNKEQVIFNHIVDGEVVKPLYK